jgi:hypothetical protein
MQVGAVPPRCSHNKGLDCLALRRPRLSAMASVNKNGRAKASAARKATLQARGRKPGEPIPESERILILADAIATSAPEAAKRWNVAPITIWKWADKAAGGMRALRDVYQLRQLGAVTEASEASLTK